MRPVSGRIGDTNGGKAASDFAFGTRLRPTIGNDIDEDCQGARVRTRHKVRKKYGLHLVSTFERRTWERTHWYATAKQRDNALRGINAKTDILNTKASPIDR